MNTVETADQTTDAESVPSTLGERQSVDADEKLNLAWDQISKFGALVVTSASITSVRWGRTVSTGNYSSVRLDVEGAVKPDRSSEDTLRELQEWVDARLPASAQGVQSLYEETFRVRAQLADINQAIGDAKLRYAMVVKVFERLGLDLPAEQIVDLPF